MEFFGVAVFTEFGENFGLLLMLALDKKKWIILCTLTQQGGDMAKTLQPARAMAMQEIVRPLGIELPARLPNYQRQAREKVYEMFAAEVDRLLGDKATGTNRGKLTGDGIALAIGSNLRLRKIPGEEGDVYGEGGGPGRDGATHGPNRWMKVTAPLRLSGIGVSEEFETGIQLQAREEYSGLMSERPNDPEERRIDLRVRTLWTPLVASSAELMFGLEPSKAYSDTSRSNRTTQGEVWRNYHAEESGSHDSDSLGFAQQNRVFGVGVEVLKRLDPDMLVLSSS